MDIFEDIFWNVGADFGLKAWSKVVKPIIKKLRNGLKFAPQKFQLDPGTTLDARTQYPFFF